MTQLKILIEVSSSHTTTQTHTHTHTFGRIPLNELSPRHRGCYLQTHDKHRRETNMPLARYKLAIPTIEWLQTYVV